MVFFFEESKSSRKRKKGKKKKVKRAYKKDKGKPPQKVDFKKWESYVKGKRKSDKELAQAYAQVPVCWEIPISNFGKNF